MISVSHDRYFIEKLATDILVIENGQITHTEKTIDKIIESKEEIAKEDKQTNKQIYRDFKRLQNRQSRLEMELLELEEDLEIHRELRYDPEYYHDYKKMDELNQTIDDIINKIKAHEKEWEEITLELED